MSTTPATLEDEAGKGPGDAPAAPAQPPAGGYPPLEGSARAFGTIALSAAVFMNVLDSSIANVSIPTIAGDLGVSATQGTWVITSFAVANAITVPLTGWLTQRFGQVRLFVLSVLLFVLSSWLCGFAWSLESLVFFRVLQGAVAGPMIPLSQSLMLASYPRAKAGMALALWSMTILVGPIAGPLLGGWISDNYSWSWIFYINVPVGLLAGWASWQVYKSRDSRRVHLPIDRMGLFLLVVWVGALQLILDKGKELEWFASPLICVLAVVTVVAFVYFVIWELTAAHPVVDLTLFAQRNFTSGTIALSVAYGVFFGTVVLLPLWLQNTMGYTATWAGVASAPVGVLAIILSPVVGKLLARHDPRPIATIAFLIFALISYMRAQFNTSVDLYAVMLPTFIQGGGHGDVLHPVDDDFPVGAESRPDPRRRRPVELLPPGLRRLRDLDHHHDLGQPRHAAPQPPDGGRPPRRAGLRPHHGRPAGPGRGPAARRRHAGRGDQPAGLHDVGHRHLLCLGADLPGPDRPDLAGPAEVGGPRRIGRGGGRALILRAH